jgi:uncharacterized protein (DUF1778 family)
MQDLKGNQPARVDFSVPAHVKARFQEAAAYETGGDLSAFLIAAGLEMADRVLERTQSLQLDETTRERFYAAMQQPAQPSDALRRLLTESDSPFRIVE